MQRAVGEARAPEQRATSVLLVDDEPALLRLTARLLEHAGYVVTTCATGAEAAARIETELFDVVVSDLEMPDLGGIALLRLLRERDVDVPVVLVTGAPTLESAMKAVEYGAFKYLTKPVTRDELIATVERATREGSGESGARRRGQGTGGGASARPSITAGTVLAERYRLERLIGSGGMGQVWEATHLLTARPVAVKVLHTGLNARPEMRRRLLREARASTSFVHPNAVEVFDVFELADATPVMVMELLHGRTLRDRLEISPRLELGETCDVMLPVVSALGTAHAHGVIHRDVKPENVFLCDDTGVVKVLDFGVAKLVHAEARDESNATATGTFIGTVGYMAPEQAIGDHDVDHRADVWSVGAVLYEMLAGVRAVPGGSMGQGIAFLLTDRPAPLAGRAPGLPPTLAALVDRMLARERSERPNDLREVFALLSDYTSVFAPTFGPPAPQSARRSEPPHAADVPLAHARTELERGGSGGSDRGSGRS